MKPELTAELSEELKRRQDRKVPRQLRCSGRRRSCRRRHVRHRPGGWRSLHLTASSCFAHTLIITQIIPASTTQSRPLLCRLISIITREICISVPCHGAGSGLCTACMCSARWVAAASLNLAAIQTSVEEDEGSLARLSAREQRPRSAHICGGNARGGGSEAEASRPRRHRRVGGGARHATPRLRWGLFVSRSDAACGAGRFPPV